MKFLLGMWDRPASDGFGRWRSMAREARMWVVGLVKLARGKWQSSLVIWLWRRWGSIIVLIKVLRSVDGILTHSQRSSYSQFQSPHNQSSQSLPGPTKLPSYSSQACNERNVGLIISEDKGRACTQ